MVGPDATTTNRVYYTYLAPSRTGSHTQHSPAACTRTAQFVTRQTAQITATSGFGVGECRLQRAPSGCAVSSGDKSGLPVTHGTSIDC